MALLSFMDGNAFFFSTEFLNFETQYLHRYKQIKRPTIQKPQVSRYPFKNLELCSKALSL